MGKQRKNSLNLRQSYLSKRPVIAILNEKPVSGGGKQPKPKEFSVQKPPTAVSTTSIHALLLSASKIAFDTLIQVNRTLAPTLAGAFHERDKSSLKTPTNFSKTLCGITLKNSPCGLLFIV